MSTADVTVKSRFKLFRAALVERYDSLRPNQKSYALAIIFFGVYWLLKPFNWDPSQGALGLAAFYWVMAVTSDLLTFYKRVAESALGKLALVILIGVSSNAAIAMAAQAVNDLTGIDPVSFPHTIAFVSVYMAVILILMAMSVLFFLGMGLALPYLFIHWMNDERSLAVLFPWYRPAEFIQYKRATITIQVSSVLAACWFAWSSLSGEQPRYMGFVMSSAEWFLYSVEMHKKAPCALGADQRVAFLRDGQVLIASRDGEEVTFRVQACIAEG